MKSRQQQQIQQTQQGTVVVYPVTKGLKSEHTAKQYKWHFDTFLKWLGLKYSSPPQAIAEMMPTWNVKELERDIIEYLYDYLHKGRHLHRSSINSSMSAIFYFCKINDIWDINRERISNIVLPVDEDHKEDRAYDRKELEKLLKESDKRIRVVLLLCTNGFRIGSIPQLNIGDLTPYPLPTSDPKPQKVYQIWVYNRSKRGRYYALVTPECTLAIDDYLAFRKKEAHEDITNEDSPLIREQFSLTEPRRKDVDKPWRISQSSLEKIIERKVRRAGLATKGKVALTHGMRKFAITQMIKAKVDYEVREYLVGHRHSRGITTKYDRLTVEDRLFEWSKSINLLTIEDDSYHLKQELQVYKDEYDKKIAQQNQRIVQQAQQIAEQRKEMERWTKGFLDREEKRLEQDRQARVRFEKMQQIYNEGIKKLGLSTELDKDGFLIVEDK